MWMVFSGIASVVCVEQKAAYEMRISDWSSDVCSSDLSVRTIHFDHKPADEDICFKRNVPRFPFVPNDPKLLDEDCYEAFNIQVEALRKRILSTGTKKIIIGVSGGLDSTHALIVAAALPRFDRKSTRLNSSH